MPDPAPSRDPEDVLVWVHVQPGARRTGVVGPHGDALKVRVTAAPVDGRANEAVADVLAEHFGVARRDVSLVAGRTSRRKRFRVTGAAPGDFRGILADHPTGGDPPPRPDVREAHRP